MTSPKVVFSRRLKVHATDIWQQDLTHQLNQGTTLISFNEEEFGRHNTLQTEGALDLPLFSILVLDYFVLLLL